MQKNRHGGNIWDLARGAECAPEEIVDFSANINPLGPPAWFRAEMSARISAQVHYPEPYCDTLCARAAEKWDIASEEVLAGNGSTEILHAALAFWKPEKALIPVPSYADYRHACAMAQIPVENFALREDAGFRLDFPALSAALDACADSRTVVFLGQPNNPTGLSNAPESVRDMALRHADTLFIVDEAFADFLPEQDRLAAARPQNVLVLHSLTKFYAIPGLRLGLGYACEELARGIRGRMPMWSVNGLSQAFGIRALSDTEYAERTVAEVKELRAQLLEGLSRFDELTVFPGEVNFVLCRIDREGVDASRLAELLLRERIAIRVCYNFEGLGEQWFRLAVRTRKQNVQLLEALAKVLGYPVSSSILLPRKKPALMLQGTSSNAGKSMLAAALCRMFLQDGYDVAPFKSQNMSLNSYVTRDGGEMGRAQVTQAQACRLDPDVRMNPVLLKPSSDTGSQVVVLGKAVSNMDIGQYIKYKPQAFDAAKDAYDSLASEHQVMILEGAGSPAEINLKRHDIVNMNMARYAEAKVLLVGDIDRGGIFASFVGTMELLEEWERELVAGYVVNMFRGDASLLNDALDYVTGRTGKPFMGVVPYMSRHGIPEEDSVSFKRGSLDSARTDGQLVDIACIDVPHISNFTDIEPFFNEPDVHVRVVRSPEELGAPDAVILPGSKNVVHDMNWLREQGFISELDRLLHSEQAVVVGICGGFQMLGRTISDEHQVESVAGGMKGLDFLPLATSLAPQKTLTATGARYLPSDMQIRGYEIHHGVTKTDAPDEISVCMERSDGKPIGYSRKDGKVWGTYLHGLFDDDSFRRDFIDSLRKKKGLEPVSRILAQYDIESALDRLADVVRASINAEPLYKMLGLK